MITIYLDTAQGVMVSEDTEDDLDDQCTKYMLEAVTRAAHKAYNDFMGVGEVVH